MAASKFWLALIQLAVGISKQQNLIRACQQVKEAAGKGAKIVTLPECFNSPYGTKYFPEYAEPIPGESTKALSAAAKENSVFLVGGSIPEKDGDKIYNTCTIWNPEGEMIGKHRKIHLFDIDVPGKIRFQESEILTAGNDFTTFDTPYCKVGVGICYDIRFAELGQVYAKQGCKLLLYPGAFNLTTGPVHWELLQRSRALDNQVYVATCSPARDETASYIAWGYSTITNPWGKVVSKAEQKETIIFGDIDLDYLDQVRQQVPLSMQHRLDLYEVVIKK